MEPKWNRNAKLDSISSANEVPHSYPLRHMILFNSLPKQSNCEHHLQEPWEGLEEPIFDEISVIWDPELRFWGPKVCICMSNAVRIHLDTSRGSKRL